VAGANAYRYQNLRDAHINGYLTTVVSVDEDDVLLLAIPNTKQHRMHIKNGRAEKNLDKTCLFIDLMQLGRVAFDTAGAGCLRPPGAESGLAILPQPECTTDSQVLHDNNNGGMLPFHLARPAGDDDACSMVGIGDFHVPPATKKAKTIGPPLHYVGCPVYAFCTDIRSWKYGTVVCASADGGKMDVLFVDGYRSRCGIDQLLLLELGVDKNIVLRSDSDSPIFTAGQHVEVSNPGSPPQRGAVLCFDSDGWYKVLFPENKRSLCCVSSM